MDRRFRLPRTWSNKELKKISHLFFGDVVNVSAWKDEDKKGLHYKEYFVNASNYFCTNFGGIRGYNKEKDINLDLTKELPIELRTQFDVVFNHTTLEHIFNIKTAFKNLCDMSKDIVILIVPAIQPQHETDSFKDYWRFTPSSIRELFFENGMKVLYESTNMDLNAGVYLFFVASKHPELWKTKIPEKVITNMLGENIGKTFLEILKDTIKSVARFIKKLVTRRKPL